MQLAERDIWMLRRIVAVLMALASLAEHAAGRCFPLRILVLSIVARAERPVRDFLFDTTGAFGPRFDDCVEVRGRPGEAALIALRLRMLASTVAALLHAECLADCCRIVGPPERVAARTGWFAAASSSAPIPADTS